MIDYSYLKLCKSGNLAINSILIDFCHAVCNAYRNTEIVVLFSENRGIDYVLFLSFIFKKNRVFQVLVF